MSIDQYFVFIFAIWNVFNYAKSENIYDDEKDKKMINSFLKLSDSLLPGAAGILEGILESPILNQCDFKCPNKSK
jgi:hypothetical protein